MEEVGGGWSAEAGALECQNDAKRGKAKDATVTNFIAEIEMLSGFRHTMRHAFPPTPHICPVHLSCGISYHLERGSKQRKNLPYL